jgi:hypothetical protein
MPISKTFAIKTFAFLLFCSAAEAGQPSYLMYSIAKAKCIKNATPTCEARVEDLREQLYTVDGVRLPDDADVKRRSDQFTLVSSDSYLSVDGSIKSLSKSNATETPYQSTDLTIEKQAIPVNEDLKKPIVIELEERK